MMFIHRIVIADVFPICFDGAKLMIQKGLSNHFQVSHALNLSSTNPGYRFGATYVGTKQVAISSQEVRSRCRRVECGF